MSLYKIHCSEHLEDFGLLVGTHKIELYEAGVVKITGKMNLSPVIRTNILFMDRNIKIRCHIAATMEDKIAGLTKYASLGDNEGLFFPYPGGERVAFHQGGVGYPLDIMFLRDNMITKMVENTKLGSTEVWSCNDCDAVIEVNGSFCGLNDVRLGDRVVYCSVSEVDVYETSQERVSESALTAFADLI